MLGMHAQVAKFNSLDSRFLSSASRLSARQNPPPPPPSLVEAGGVGGGDRTVTSETDTEQISG